MNQFNEYFQNLPYPSIINIYKISLLGKFINKILIKYLSVNIY